MTGDRRLDSSRVDDAGEPAAAISVKRGAAQCLKICTLTFDGRVRALQRYSELTTGALLLYVACYIHTYVLAYELPALANAAQ